MQFIHRWQASRMQNVLVPPVPQWTIDTLPDPIKCRKGVIHIGAHRCEEEHQYAQFPKVLWIDGNDDLCAQYPQIVNAIIADEDGKNVNFHVTNNDAMSSSILELKEHLQEHPDCHAVKTVPKTTITLDTLLVNLEHKHTDFDMLVMDIQGAELLALKGAAETLKHINVIVTEVNTKELYKDCVLLPDLDMFLNDRGFVRIQTDMTQHGWGDAIYVRRIITTKVHSGLGNRLFQIAALYGIANATHSMPVLYKSLMDDVPVHTDNHWKYQPFYDIIPNIENNIPSHLFHIINEDPEKPGVYVDYAAQIKDKPFVCLSGYFQSPRFFDTCTQQVIDHFHKALSLASAATINDDACFMHIRGRDHGYKWDNMRDYYVNAALGENVIKVYTDDPDFAASLGYKNIEPPCDDLETLRQMISCGKGGICCNSTFSWWAAFLGPAPSYIVPFPFNHKVDVQDIYASNMIKHSIMKDFTQSLVHARFIDGKYLNLIFMDLLETGACVINKTILPQLLLPVPKSRHNDPNYNVFTVATAALTETPSSLTIYGKTIPLVFTPSPVPFVKYDLVAMTMLSPEDFPLIPSYISHYTSLGVQQFYFYVNSPSSQDTPTRHHNNATFVHWPHPYTVNGEHYAQISAMTDMLYYGRHVCHHILFNDVDEYIDWKPTNTSLTEFLKAAAPPFNAVAFNNRFIKLNDPQKNDTIHERITRKEFTYGPTSYSYKNRSKCIVNPNKVDVMGVHSVMIPETFENVLELGYTTAELLHVCNFEDRLNVSVHTKDKTF